MGIARMIRKNVTIRRCGAGGIDLQVERVAECADEPGIRVGGEEEVRRDLSGRPDVRGHEVV
jgi:hypothetical protein